MTHEETREQKAQLMLEHHEAEAALADIREKALRMAGRLVGAGEELKSFAQFAEPDIRDVSGKFGDIPTAQDVAAAAGELWKASGVLHDLKKRKDSLGLK